MRKLCEGPRPCTLIFGYFDESAERVSSFLKFSEITQIENNFPFKLGSAELLTRLVDSNDVVYDSYT